MQAEGLIVAHQEVIPGHYSLVLANESIARQSKPGQFLHVLCGESYDPLLRRPISIHALNKDKGEVTLLYRVVGQGTSLLAQKKVGERLDVLGPLGQGFILPEAIKKLVIVGGGMGIAPVFALAQEAIAKGKEVCFLAGALTEKMLLAIEELEVLGVDLSIATDDGSLGFQGNTVDLLERLLVKDKPDLICACGPKPMLRGVARLALLKGIDCQVSLEEHMACGVGACLGCVCKTKKKDQNTYSKVCKDGPVFLASEVNWDD